VGIGERKLNRFKEREGPAVISRLAAFCGRHLQLPRSVGPQLQCQSLAAPAWRATVACCVALRTAIHQFIDPARDFQERDENAVCALTRMLCVRFTRGEPLLGGGW
jgi:hypothetical protein